MSPWMDLFCFKHVLFLYKDTVFRLQNQDRRIGKNKKNDKIHPAVGVDLAGFVVLILGFTSYSQDCFRSFLMETSLLFLQQLHLLPYLFLLLFCILSYEAGNIDQIFGRHIPLMHRLKEISVPFTKFLLCPDSLMINHFAVFSSKGRLHSKESVIWIPLLSLKAHMTETALHQQFPVCLIKRFGCRCQSVRSYPGENQILNYAYFVIYSGNPYRRPLGWRLRQGYHTDRPT